MIYIACDHGGYPAKLKIKDFFAKKKVEIEDLGTNSTDSVDYPDFAEKMAKSVLANPDSTGILICRTGIGMSMAVNRFKGIRGALCRSVKDAFFARSHNNANVLILCAGDCGCRRKKIINTFFNTEFEEGRHTARVKKLDELGK